MGPLQYLVVGYEREQFRDEVLPELNNLSHRRIIRMIDVVFVTRDERGGVESRELAEVLPDQAGLIAPMSENIFESLTQDDIDVVGDALPRGGSVALLLFEHRWADRLEQAVQVAGRFLDDAGARSAELAVSLEYELAMGRPRQRVAEA